MDWEILLTVPSLIMAGFYLWIASKTQLLSINFVTLIVILLSELKVYIESLERLYTFREPTEVLQFLEKYPFLVPLLLEAHEHIRRHFPDSPLFLQYVPAPEIDDPQLVVYIATDLDPEEALDSLELLDDWWVEVPNRSQSKMYFNLGRLDDDF